MKTLILIIIFLLATWEIKAQNAVDYRDTFCGSYSCTRIYRHVDSEKNQIVNDTSLVIINVSKNNADSLFTINTNEGISNLKFINGKLYPVNKLRFSGTINGNGIYLRLVPSPGPVSIIYSGIK